MSTNVDYMIIECNGTMNAPTFYHEAMSFFHDRADIDDRIRNNNGSAKPFGILMFGADSISQFNLRRVMPLTYEYFQAKNWFELSGYNKVKNYFLSNSETFER